VSLYIFGDSKLLCCITYPLERKDNLGRREHCHRFCFLSGHFVRLFRFLTGVICVVLYRVLRNILENTLEFYRFFNLFFHLMG
jgi:hypothetical protein